MTSATRTAIVTGASRGIGRAIALRLAADGFNIVVNYAGNAGAAEETASAVRALGRESLAVKADIAEEDAVRNLYRQSEAAFGRVDVVVNNAGVMSMGPITMDSVGMLDETLRVNLRGTFLMMTGAAKHLQDGGRFIALSSSVLAKNFPGYGPYIASKAAVEGLVRVFANELRGRNIAVNAVAPGPVGTELFYNGKTEEQVAAMAAMVPMERIGTPEEIAGAVSFLAGPDGAWVNGQVLRSNGGLG